MERSPYPELKAIGKKIKVLEKKKDGLVNERKKARLRINRASQEIIRAEIRVKEAQLKREKVLEELTKIDTSLGQIGKGSRSANRKLNDVLAKSKERRETLLKLDQDSRKHIIAEAGGKCEVCGSTENLEVHHITSRNLGGSNKRENLALLCNGCHGRVHSNGF